MRVIGNIDTDTNFVATATGTIPNGAKIIVNTNGTVSAIAQSVNAAGTHTEWRDADVEMMGHSGAYDPINKKLAICYKDMGENSKVRVIAGTVSANTITWGNPLTLSTGIGEYPTICFDAKASKFVCIFQDNGVNSYGRWARVAANSSDNNLSLDYGPGTVYSGVGAFYDVHYDPVAQLTTYFYMNNNGYLYAGTIEVTGPTIGNVSNCSPNEACYGISACYMKGPNVFACFHSSGTNQQVKVAAYDAATNTWYARYTVGATSVGTGLVAAFNDDQSQPSGTSYGACVAVNNQTDLNFMTVTMANSTTTFNNVAQQSVDTGLPAGSYKHTMSYDGYGKRFIITYADSNGDFVAKSLVQNDFSLTINNTKITLISGASGDNPCTVFIPEINKTAAVYRQTSDNDGYYQLLTVEGGTNLSEEAFIGITSTPAADGNVVTIDTACSISRNQNPSEMGSGLGIPYYIDPDGTLSINPASSPNPTVIAGTAISTTEIIVEG